MENYNTQKSIIILLVLLSLWLGYKNNQLKSQVVNCAKLIDEYNQELADVSLRASAAYKTQDGPYQEINSAVKSLAYYSPYFGNPCRK